MRIIPFTSYRRIAYAFSIGSILLFAAITAMRGGFAYGIDFAGGTTVLVKFREPVDDATLAKIRAALAPQGLGENIRTEMDPLGNPAHTVEISLRGADSIQERLDKIGSDVAAALAPVFPSSNPSAAAPLFDVNASASPAALALDLAHARALVHASALAAQPDSAWRRSAGAAAEAAGLDPVLASLLERELSSETAAAALGGDRPTLASDPEKVLSVIEPGLAERYLSVAAEVFAVRESLRGGIFASAEEAAAAARSKSPDAAGAEAAALFSRAAAAPFVVVGVETVGPVVGETIKRQAAWAVFLSLFFGILCYVWVRFELRFSVGAIVATAHDALFVTFLLGALHHEITVTVIAAILTVIGYSVNDTIVVYDRIRERLGGADKLPTEPLLDQAVTETLSRTIITGMTTLFSLFAFYLIGPSVLQDFCLVLFVGILVGTFSSIFVAAPILLEWDRIAKKK